MSAMLDDLRASSPARYATLVDRLLDLMESQDDQKVQSNVQKIADRALAMVRAGNFGRNLATVGALFAAQRIGRREVDSDPKRVRRWTSADLSEHTGMSKTTLRDRVIGEMQAAGVINRRGNLWFGRPADIDAWLLGTWKGQP